MPKSIPSSPTRKFSSAHHPVNLFILPDDRQLADPFVRILFDLDEKHDALQEAFHEAIAGAIADAFGVEGWDSDTANRFMMWILWAYESVPDEYLFRQFTRINPNDFPEIRQALKQEAVELLGERMLQRYKAMPYAEYLRTEHWQQVRKDALRYAEYRCQLCNASTELHVHHRTYERRGEELPSDVIVLCAECHRHFHDKLKVQK